MTQPTNTSDWVDEVLASVKAIVDMQTALVHDLLAALTSPRDGGDDD